MQKKILICGLLCLLLFVFISGGCAKKPQGKVIATINGDPIYVKDLNREIALSFRRNPMFKVSPQTLENQLNILIDRRLLIQEARKKNLDRTDRFVNTIKAFWEQTLIRDLMAYKNKELVETAPKEEKDKKELLDEWFSGIRKDADVKVNRDVLKDFKYQ
jgi:hypothetical protein